MSRTFCFALALVALGAPGLASAAPAAMWSKWSVKNTVKANDTGGYDVGRAAIPDPGKEAQIQLQYVCKKPGQQSQTASQDKPYLMRVANDLHLITGQLAGPMHIATDRRQTDFVVIGHDDSGWACDTRYRVRKGH